MIVTFDSETDTVYLYFVDDIKRGQAARTVPGDPSGELAPFYFDFDAAGRLVGIEISDASRVLTPEFLSAIYDYTLDDTP
jgi:uncharacterized protein YuzE